MSKFTHLSAWQRLNSRVENNGIPHAILITGRIDAKRFEFARAFGKSLLCKQRVANSGLACGACSACHLLVAGSHGDYMEIVPEEDSRTIKIQQIRNLCAELALTAQQGGYRVAVINPADVMNTSAANSLLKTLEEPPAGVILLLVSSKLGAIPATIRSRCQRVRLDNGRPGNGDEVQANLAGPNDWCSGLVEGDKLLNLANDWAKLDHEQVFAPIFAWLHQRIRAILGVSSDQCGGEFAATGNFRREAAKIELRQLYGFYDKLTVAYRQATKPGISRRALYEQLFVEARARHLV